jgi:transcriptional regulator GlxA family with amidase domain
MLDSDVKTVVFVAYPGVTALDLVGPLQVFSCLRLMMPTINPVVAGETLEPLDTDTPLRLVPDTTFADVPAPFGLLVPGGMSPAIRAMGNHAVIGYIQRAARSAEFVASVCTGALILAAAGLLDGRPATTHWAFEPQLNRLGSRYQAERWVEDGKFCTSAGVSAGIDLALHLVDRIAGRELAKQVQLRLEYDPKPPTGPINWSRVDRDQSAPTVDQWVREGLANHPELRERLMS